MLRGAADAGLDAVGFTDHCSLSDAWRDERLLWNRNFDRTYERRREALAIADEQYDVRTYDAVEIDYERELEGRIESFLDRAAFDYAIGSVHYVEGRQVFAFESFADVDLADRRRFVDAYYDAVVSLIESELFAVVGHVDLVENHPDLHGLTTEDHRRRVVEACANSRTVPEINGGRTGEKGSFDLFHPTEELLDRILERDVAVTVGTDAHDPDDFKRRVPRLERLLSDHGIDPIGPAELSS